MVVLIHYKLPKLTMNCPHYVSVSRGTIYAPGCASLKCTYDEMYYYYYT